MGKTYENRMGNMGKAMRKQWENEEESGTNHENMMGKSGPGQILCKWVNRSWFQSNVPELNIHFNELFMDMFDSRRVKPRCFRK